MFETITDKLTIVHGGAKTDAQLMADGQTMQNWLNCNKDVQAKLNDGQAAAMAKARGHARHDRPARSRHRSAGRPGRVHRAVPDQVTLTGVASPEPA